MLSPWFVSSQSIHNSLFLSPHLGKRITLLATIFMADFMGRARSFRLTTAFGKLLEATSIPIKKSCLNRSKNLPQRNTKVLAKEYEVLNSYGLVLCALCVCFAHFAVKILFLKKAVSTDLRIYRKGIQRFSQRNMRY